MKDHSHPEYLSFLKQGKLSFIQMDKAQAVLKLHTKVWMLLSMFRFDIFIFSSAFVSCNYFFIYAFFTYPNCVDIFIFYALVVYYPDWYIL